MKKRVVKILVGVLVAGAVLGGAALGAIRWHIHQSVQECCGVAQQAHLHPGDDVAALDEFINDESHSLRDRNMAVWALGQMRDSQALSVLESVYTGDLCTHDKSLCQYELEKSIKLCGRPPNPPRKTKH